jgi:1-acyl-sn-glycerol-3-phosphate acyltransferase
MFYYLSLFILSIFLLFGIIPMFSVSFIVWLITFNFDKKRIVLHKLTSFFGGLILYAMPAFRIKINGRKKINKNSTYVIVSNHQSELDILLCLKLNFHFKFVSKVEVLRIPFIGWMIWFNKYVTLRRGFMDSIVKMMKDCETKIDEGSSVLLFPEGTRSKTGKVIPFKQGAFILAKNKKVPILPVVIEGSYNAFFRKSYKLFGRHTIQLKVLDEIAYQEFANMDFADIAKMVENKIAKELNQL